MSQGEDWIQIRGARQHNLRNLDLDLPRGQLTVFSGPSGSGKSSLVFDTLHAEGQRRYLETLRGDARALFDQLKRPDVDLIAGLPPTLCVAQKTGSFRPRSTLATLTEIHDHLRLLWARYGIPHCWQCGTPITRSSIAEVLRDIAKLPEGSKLYILAPLVRDRPGAHAETIQQMKQGGFLRARVDGVLHEIASIPKLPAKKNHTIEVVVDRLVHKPGIEERLTESLHAALTQGQGHVIITQADDGDWHDMAFSTRFECPRCQIAFPELEPRLFSFNNPHGACAMCAGLGQVWEVDPRLLIPDRTKSLAQTWTHLVEELPEDAPLAMPGAEILQNWSPGLDVKKPLSTWPDEAVSQLIAFWSDPLRPILRGDDDVALRDALQGLAGFVPCPDCGGSRLNLPARSVRFANQGLHEVTAWSVDRTGVFFERLASDSPVSQSAHDGLDKVRATIVAEVGHRLRFLREVGLGYLTLDRPAPTLSGGEAQRARLATHLGGGLVGVCFILDEPTIGLHPRDTQRLIEALRRLQQRGNTVLVVEHDEEVIRDADFLIDIGPGAGVNGGRLLAAGTVKEVLANPASVTGKWLAGGAEVALAGGERLKDAGSIIIRNARHHNLKNLDVTIPLGKFVCLTGVSGSGKSSLGRDILCHAARRHLGLLAPPPGLCDAIEGLEQLEQVIEVDQKPLGRSSRSNPASYVGLFDEIRKVFAQTKVAKLRGYKANRFSFNTRGGRCEECLGQGVKRVALQFLPDLETVCPVCQGQRFNPATLEVDYKGKNVAQILEMPIAEARAFFKNIPGLTRGLTALDEVGLGYLALGQPASTLSGGEAQRVKLAAQLAKNATGRTLYLLDEPTTGLHFSDVANLVRVLKQLVAAGHSLVVIEHHLDLIAAADWIIDLGPDGGDAGGYLVAQGNVSQVAACGESLTGRALSKTRNREPKTENREPKK